MNEEDDNDAVVKDCIFCSIASGQTNAEVVFDSDKTLFFHDISPKAKVHVIGIPKKHIVSIAEAGEEDKELVWLLMRDAAQVASELGLSEGGYRVITNVGSNAGQEVKHLHWHLLGGENLGSLVCHKS